MKQINTIIFDLDGTLLDTLTDLTDSVNYTLRQYHLPLYTLDDIRSFLGNGMEQLVACAVPEGKENPHFDSIYADFKTYYMKHSTDKTSPYPGILKLLRYLKENHYKIAIVSNKGYEAVQYLNTFYFSDLIDVAIGERSDIRRKPYPDTVNEALRLLKCQKEEALYVGDSEVDILTAQNSGLSCLSVTWGFRTKEQLLEHGATHLFTSPKELLQYFEKENNH